MATYSATDITSRDFHPTDNLFLDANVWLYVFGSRVKPDRRVEVYSDALKRILSAKSRIFIDTLVLSEFINTRAREEWKHGDYNLEPFKTFRESDAFAPVAEGIAKEARRVLKWCIRVESGFASVAIDSLLDEYARGHCDYNDRILAALCRQNDWHLVTHDADFKGCQLSVLTANKSLLT